MDCGGRAHKREGLRNSESEEIGEAEADPRADRGRVGA
jgi:hypothetical protein